MCGLTSLDAKSWKATPEGKSQRQRIHDGILFELDNEEQVTHAVEIMRGAGRDVCGGFEIDVDVDQKLIGGARYRDKRPVAESMWNTVMATLQAIGALPKVG